MKYDKNVLQKIMKINMLKNSVQLNNEVFKICII